MFCLRGYRDAYIGRWDEPGPSDQTDFDQWRGLDLNGGLELTYEADHNPAQGTVGQRGVWSAHHLSWPIEPNFGGLLSRVF
jgi:hypothetical protein